MQTATAPTRILCDCLFVVQGVQALLNKQKVQKLDHQDIWKKIQECTEKTPEGYYIIQKVKAHTTMAHVRDGRISMEDKIMNDEVDELAKN